MASIRNALSLIAALGLVCTAAARGEQPLTLENSGYRLTARKTGAEVRLTLEDRLLNLRVADGPCLYRARAAGQELTSPNLDGAAVTIKGETLTIRGRLASLDVEHTFTLPAGRPIMEERIRLWNGTGTRIALELLEMGLQRPVADPAGTLAAELDGDRFTALPLRHRADAKRIQEWSLAELISEPAVTYRPTEVFSQPKTAPSSLRVAEGWAWTHGNAALGIFSFSQDLMRFSALAAEERPDATMLRMGGFAMVFGEPAALSRIAPGQTVDLGVTRFQSVRGGFPAAALAFRAMLDEKGCRFPDAYNPPVHWEQLYDMEGAWDHRPERYTQAALDKEAVKARAYHCEALYLDPGWDTTFGSFLWGESWLGRQAKFADAMKQDHGLTLALHCPMPPWASSPGMAMGPFRPEDWPTAARRRVPGASARPSTGAPPAAAGPVLCMGSTVYLAEAAKRLLERCAQGAVFMMFDGVWWNGPCDDPAHGHAIPYRMEDHIRACVDLARRVHARYPSVLIEMHDMLAGGTTERMTPVYYKYGLPGSYDENWGFELMWDPMADLKSGRARTLYDYNLGCNIPAYLHIDLRKDNEHGVVLWWYASTCRHLGIGGTHPRPEVVQVHQDAMRQYHRLDRFFKRGEFFGINEEIHVHVLKTEASCVVNVFNLSDKERVVGGKVGLRELGLDPAGHYQSRQPWAQVADGVLSVQRGLPAWSADLVEIVPAK